MSQQQQKQNPTLIGPDDVGFVPTRIAPAVPISPSDDLTVATATTLVKEFGTCPHCEADIDPDTAGGIQTDRDVLWTDDSSEGLGRSACDRSEAHTCENCGERLEILVEEKAEPNRKRDIPDEPWVTSHLWIKLDDEEGYVVVNPNAIYIN